MLARCLCRALARGRAVRAPRESKVLIAVLTGKLGDIVCGTPILRALRAKFPHARLIAAGGRVLRPLLADSGLADECLDIDDITEAQLRSFRADAAVLTGPSFAAAAKLYLAGIPLVTAPRVVDGYSPFETWPYRILKRLIATYPYRMGHYAPRERLRCLEPLGIISEDTTKKLGYSDAAAERVERFFAESGIGSAEFVVGVSATAGNKIKEWPEERFAQVIDRLAAEGARAVLIGGPADKERVDRVMKHLQDPARVVNAQGRFDIDELKALVARFSLFIAVDTGPIYVAEAFGVPTLDIVGPMDENEQPPRGRYHRTVVPRRTRPELRVLNARVYDATEAARQTLSITAAEVSAEALALMRDILRR